MFGTFVRKSLSGEANFGADVVLILGRTLGPILGPTLKPALGSALGVNITCQVRMIWVEDQHAQAQHWLMHAQAQAQHWFMHAQAQAQHWFMHVQAQAQLQRKRLRHPD